MNFNCSIKQCVAKYLLSYCQNVDNIYIAFSGGVDSCVLLDSIVKINKELNLNKNIIAIHVNHNISQNSKDWENFCYNFCEKLDIKIHTHEVNLKVNKDQSLESVARSARYNIFKKYLNKKNNILITAHHQNDQAETVLLNLLRGSGIAGLSGMSIISDLDKNYNYKILRPLLDLNKKTLSNYAKDNNLVWIEDESNSSIDYSRNFLRHEIIPNLIKKWPAAISKISHAALHCQDAKDYIDDNIKSNYSNAISKDSLGYIVLNIDYLKNLNLTEKRYLLRYYLSNQGASYPSKIKLDEILDQALNAKQDANISISWKDNDNIYEIKRFKNNLYLLKNYKKYNKAYNSYKYQLGDKLFLKEIDKYLEILVNNKLDNNKIYEIKFKANINCNEYFIPVWERDNIIFILDNNQINYIILPNKKIIYNKDIENIKDIFINL